MRAGVLIKLKVLHQEGGSGSDMEAKRLLLMRSLFTVGAMCRHFDFDQEHFKGDSTVGFYLFVNFLMNCYFVCMYLLRNVQYKMPMKQRVKTKNINIHTVTTYPEPMPTP